jgi:hypothetical protein
LYQSYLRVYKKIKVFYENPKIFTEGIMSIAVISFDQDFITQIKRELPEEKIRGYIDSLSMLKELSEFNPDIIIYDASSGEFAIDDLKFLLTREKVEKKKFRILLSREQPVDIDSFPEVEDIIYYTKETDIPKLVSDIKAELGVSPKSKEEPVLGETPISADTMESFLEPTVFEESVPEPHEDIMEHLGEFSLSEEEEKEIKESLELLGEHKPEAKKEEKQEEMLESFFSLPEEEQKVKEEPASDETVSFQETFSQPQETSFSQQPPSSPGTIRIEIDISVDDIKKTIAEKAVEQLVKDVLKSPEMEELINNIQRDFVERTEDELEKIKEELKKELKDKLSSSLEKELRESLLETIKEDVAKLTSQIVKERLEQLFGGR